MARTVKLSIYEPSNVELKDLLRQKRIYKKTICGNTSGPAGNSPGFSLAGTPGVSRFSFRPVRPATMYCKVPDRKRDRRSPVVY
jgi:hypothetical protein